MKRYILLILTVFTVGLYYTQFSDSKLYPYSDWKSITPISDFDQDGDLEYIVYQEYSAKSFNVNNMDSSAVEQDDVNFIHFGVPPVLSRIQTLDANFDGWPDLAAIKDNRFITVYLNSGNNSFVFQSEYEFIGDIKSFKIKKNLDSTFNFLSSPNSNNSLVLELLYDNIFLNADTVFMDSTLSAIHNFDYIKYDTDYEMEILFGRIDSSYLILDKVGSNYLSVDTLANSIKYCEVVNLNNDGLDDLFIYDTGNGNNFILHENQGSQFSQVNVVDSNINGFHFSHYDQYTHSAIVDIDGDGLLDLLVNSNVYYNAIVPSAPVPSLWSGRIKQVIDVNNDSIADWVSTNKSIVDDVLNYFDTIDSSRNQNRLFDFHSNVKKIVVFDFDNDSIEDVLSFYDNINNLSPVPAHYVILNEIDGDVKSVNKLEGLIAFEEFLFVGDLNNDGLKDILYRNTSLEVILAKAVSEYEFTDYDTLSNIYGKIEIGDMDNSNGDDIVFTDESDIIIAYNDGFGNFNTFNVIESSADIKDIKIEDFENDGFPEIVRVNWSTNSLGVWRNNSNSYLLNDFSAGGQYSEYVEIEDLNNDGFKECILKGEIGGYTRLLIFENDGSNNFAWSNIAGTGYPTHNLEFVNLNNDGLVDLLFTSSLFFADAMFFENLGNFNFGNISTYTFSTSTSGAIEAKRIDLGNDGMDDLVYEANELGLRTAYNLNSGVFLIGGQVFWDYNDNGVKDSIEIGFKNQLIYNQNINQPCISNSQGFFNIAGVNGSNLIEIGNLFSTSLHLSTPAVLNIDLDSINPIIDTLFFGIGIDSIYSDISLSFINSQVRCNEFGNLIFKVSNNGTKVENLIIEIEIDDSLNFSSSFPIADSTNLNHYFYSIDNLLPGSNENILLNVIYPDFNSMGDTLNVKNIVFSKDSIGNISVEDSIQGEMVLTCAYDPNDKTVSPSGISNRGFVRKYEELIYLIRFQNTGNASATNISIEDQISNKLNLESFKVISSSHPMDTEINTNGSIKFVFDNIMLPDSNTNFLGSQGYVQYSIQLDSNLNFGDEIFNTAEIYFDYNPAIVTNTTLTTVECPVPIITNDGTQLSVDLDFPVDWFLNDELIASNTYNVLLDEEGFYKACYNNQNGCEESSELETYFVSIEGLDMNSFITYPNPTFDILNVKFEQTPSFSSELVLYNLQGEIVETFSNLSTDYSIDLNGLPNGYYFLRMLDGDTYSISKKIILLK